MQIQSLRIKSYRSWRINDTASSDAICRLRKLKLYALLASEGCSPASRLQATGWSKATCYRQQGRAGKPESSPWAHPQIAMDETTGANGIPSAPAVSAMGETYVVEDSSGR